MFEGTLVRLRALEASDAEHLFSLNNEYSVRRWTGEPLPRSRKETEERLQKAMAADPWKDSTVVFAVCEKETGRFLGLARLYDIKRPHDRASIGVSIRDPAERSKGFGTDATRVLLRIGFCVLGLHSIYLDTMEDNVAAIQTAKNVGFKRIGVFRETEYIEGQYRGIVYMDILRDEYLKLYKQCYALDLAQ